MPNVVIEVSRQEEKNHYETVTTPVDEVKGKVCGSVFVYVLC